MEGDECVLSSPETDELELCFRLQCHNSKVQLVRLVLHFGPPIQKDSSGFTAV